MIAQSKSPVKEKTDFLGPSLYCHCGHHIETDEFYNESENDAMAAGETTNYKTVTCSDCGSIHDLKLSFVVDVEMTECTVTSRTAPVIDNEGRTLYPADIETLHIGDRLAFDDGSYHIHNYYYYVQDETITNIFSAITDENQLTLFS